MAGEGYHMNGREHVDPPPHTHAITLFSGHSSPSSLHVEIDFEKQAPRTRMHKVHSASS